MTLPDALGRVTSEGVTVTKGRNRIRMVSAGRDAARE
jgi:hypothetical protein